MWIREVRGGQEVTQELVSIHRRTTFRSSLTHRLLALAALRSAATFYNLGQHECSAAPHAVARLMERGATEAEVVETMLDGEPFAAKLGRSGFRRNFPFDGEWLGKRYAVKQLEVIAVREGDDWLALTVITKFF